MMIKLIATEFDGTLLDNDRKLPDEIFSVVEKLDEMGILFAPASGRQYANLVKLFAPVKDKTVFICENGSLVKYREKTLLIRSVPENKLKRALDEIRAVPHLYPMLCGAQSAYIENTAQPFYRLATEAYTNCALVERLEDVIGKEEICKISVFDDLGAAEHCIRFLPERLPALRTILSGRHWCDISSPDSDKGNAVRHVQKTFGLNKDECIAFGDHMNDLEMLSECGTAYVTENAYPALKQIFKNTVPANTQGGVVWKIKEIIKEFSL